MSSLSCEATRKMRNIWEFECDDREVMNNYKIFMDNERNISMINKSKFKKLSYKNVLLTDEYCVNAYEKECDYLKQLSPDRLLCGFRKTAGLKGKASRYSGWENTEIQGHTLGHYLSAISQGYAYSGDEEFKTRLEYICKELEICQREDECETALKVASRLGDWVYDRASKWSKETQLQVLSVEYGGMNDCLYNLYKATGEKKYAIAAHIFDEEALFDHLRKKEDVLNGLHANTTIPKIIGALNRYQSLEGMDDYLEIAENFFDIVNKNHTYVTGGNSEWEHFGKSQVLDMERTSCNCETCNTYNMLKLSDSLFQLTGKTKYSDFYENTWINAILSSQNPETGMTTYFQPMATGFFKVYSTPFDKFWCCTGTGMENFTKLCEGMIYQKEKGLYINRFVSSKIKWEEKNVLVSLNANFPKSDILTIIVEGDISENGHLNIRIPEWSGKDIQGRKNGKEISPTVVGSYIQISELQNKVKIEIKFPMEVRVYELPDNKNAVAFKYGPVVLSANMGTESMETTVTGVDVTVPTKDFFVKDYFVLNQEPNQWKKDIRKNLVRKPNTLEFVLNNTDEDEGLIFTPHFKQHTQRYGIYFRLYKKDAPELVQIKLQQQQKDELKKHSCDIIPVGNDQYELAHQVKGEKTESGVECAQRCRIINKDGWLSYEMKTDTSETFLHVMYKNTEEDTESLVYINNQEVSGERIDETGKIAELEKREEEPGKLINECGFYTKRYRLPKGINSNGVFVVKFENKPNQNLSYIFDDIYIQKIDIC